MNKDLETILEHSEVLTDETLEKFIKRTEEEIIDLKKSSISNINRIATETTTVIIKQIINTEVNKSSVSAIVSDFTKKQMEKHTLCLAYPPPLKKGSLYSSLCY